MSELPVSDSAEITISRNGERRDRRAALVNHPDQARVEVYVGDRRFVLELEDSSRVRLEAEITIETVSPAGLLRDMEPIQPHRTAEIRLSGRLVEGRVERA